MPFAPSVMPDAGSPPRVRGKVDAGVGRHAAVGITPACAGKRNCCCHRAGTLRDHPRVCGEKQTPRLSQSTAQGSPPRVRGKVYKCVQAHTSQGITPACAGKSQNGLKKTADDRGSPPRVRGKADRENLRRGQAGITPACAGKRALRQADADLVWDHPRVCGEKWNSSNRRTVVSGSPPRVRGKGLALRLATRRLGITPACAGKRVGTS